MRDLVVQVKVELPRWLVGWWGQSWATTELVIQECIRMHIHPSLLTISISWNGQLALRCTTNQERRFALMRHWVLTFFPFVSSSMTHEELDDNSGTHEKKCPSPSSIYDNVLLPRSIRETGSNAKLWSSTINMLLPGLDHVSHLVVVLGNWIDIAAATTRNS